MKLLYFDWDTEINYTKSNSNRNSVSYHMRQFIVIDHGNKDTDYLFTTLMRKSKKNKPKDQLPTNHQEALDFLFEHNILTRPVNIVCLSCTRVGLRWKMPDKKVVHCPNHSCNHNGKKLQDSNTRFTIRLFLLGLS